LPVLLGRFSSAAQRSPSRSRNSRSRSPAKSPPRPPSLLEIPGCGSLTAAKILGETADVRRFKSKDAFARFNGTAPLPVWTSNHPRHRLSRVGNRQLNCAVHRIALTQAHWHADARSYLERRKAAGDTTKEAIRVLKRRLSDVVYRALLADSDPLSVSNGKEFVIPAA
jgi:transposase